jgi:hypothetical protein
MEMTLLQKFKGQIFAQFCPLCIRKNWIIKKNSDNLEVSRKVLIFATTNKNQIL